MTFKEFIYERGPLPNYSDNRIRPADVSPDDASRYSAAEDDRQAKHWVRLLLLEWTNNMPSKSLGAVRESVKVLWQSIQKESNFDRIKELIFTSLENHKLYHTAQQVLSIIRPDQGGGAAVLAKPVLAS